MGHDHSRRASWRISGAVFLGLFAISKFDGVVNYPGDHDVPDASMARSPVWREARTRVHRSGDSGVGPNRRSDVAANEFIRGFRSRFLHRVATA